MSEDDEMSVEQRSKIRQNASPKQTFTVNQANNEANNSYADTSEQWSFNPGEINQMEDGEGIANSG